MELSPLHAAVEVGDLSRVQTLLDAGANIEERQDTLQNSGVDSRTPLFFAAEKGHVAVARYLVERGAKKEAKAQYGKTALMIAAYNGHFEVVRVLIEHGADRDALNNSHWTALLCASCNGHVAVAEYLLEQGSDVDHDNTDGYTSLHAAGNHLEVVQLLLRWGAKLDVRHAYNGDTAADRATRYGFTAIADAIRAEELNRRWRFKRDRSTIEGTEEHAASKRPRAEREAEEAAAAAAAEAVDESDDDDDEDDDEEEEG